MRERQNFCHTLSLVSALVPSSHAPLYLSSLAATFLEIAYWGDVGFNLLVLLKHKNRNIGWIKKKNAMKSLSSSYILVIGRKKWGNLATIATWSRKPLLPLWASAVVPLGKVRLWWLEAEVSASARQRGSENLSRCGGTAVGSEMPLSPACPCSSRFLLQLFHDNMQITTNTSRHLSSGSLQSVYLDLKLMFWLTFLFISSICHSHTEALEDRPAVRLASKQRPCSYCFDAAVFSVTSLFT